MTRAQRPRLIPQGYPEGETVGVPVAGLTLTDRYLLEHRLVFLTGNIDQGQADRAVRHLLLLNSLDRRSDIGFYIFSFGGEEYAGLAIYDCMQMIEAPVATCAIGAACSMAAVLLAAGDKGKRYATPNAHIMIHQAWASSISGRVSEVQVAASLLTKDQKLLTKILARHTGRDEEEIERAIQQERWMTPHQAKEFGLIDGVLSGQPVKLHRADDSSG